MSAAALDVINTLPPLQRKFLLLQALKESRRINRLGEYDPTGVESGKRHEKQLEFHAAGQKYPIRALLGGNRTGKTAAGGAEDAYHLTGLYPDWWEGRRFDSPVRWLVGSDTTESTRDGIQTMLLGAPDDWGTGLIPKRYILDMDTRRGVSDAVDTAIIEHTTGGKSMLQFKSYDMGRRKWQSTSRHGVHFDEEPPIDIYREGQQRVNDTGGIIYLTMTPLQGLSEVVRMFYGSEFDRSPDRWRGSMAWRDNPWLDPRTLEMLERDLPPHQLDARRDGRPQLGSGAVFPVADSDIIVKPFELPRHWPQIGGLDFGWDHPFAAVRIAHDRDNDVVYLVSEYRARQSTPAQQTPALRPWGKSLPWAWPHDGLQHDKGHGTQLATLYRQEGLKLLPEHAKFEDGSNSVEAGILDMLQRMQSGRLKVFSTCQGFLEEKGTYHRKDGKLIKEHDDIICAARYALMCIRFARVPEIDRPMPRIAPVVNYG